MKLIRPKKTTDKIIAITGIFSAVAITVGYTIQKQSENKQGDLKCSYLDPISIDIVALGASIFLICEGLYQIYFYKDLSFTGKILISIRTAFAFSILTLHIMQFIHK